jgi:hypothetical protein
MPAAHRNDSRGSNIKLAVNNVPAVLAGTNLIVVVILEQSKVNEQGEEGEAKTLLGGRPLL